MAVAHIQPVTTFPGSSNRVYRMGERHYPSDQVAVIGQSRKVG